MAYYDESGRITIDEDAANADIRRINSAIACLQESVKALNSLIQEASAEKGRTSEAIVEKGIELRNQISGVKLSLIEAAETIRNTVNKYRAIDQKHKMQMESSIQEIQDIMNQNNIVSIFRKKS